MQEDCGDLLIEVLKNLVFFKVEDCGNLHKVPLKGDCGNLQRWC